MVALKTLIFSALVPGTVAGVIPWFLLQGQAGAVLPIPSIWMIGLLPLLLLFRSFPLVGYALLVAATVHGFVIFVEEPSLRHQFGVGYETYLRMVPRWLPRSPRHDVLP